MQHRVSQAARVALLLWLCLGLLLTATPARCQTPASAPADPKSVPQPTIITRRLPAEITCS